MRISDWSSDVCSSDLFQYQRTAHRITSPWKWRHLKSVIVPSVQSPPSMLKLHDFCNRALDPVTQHRNGRQKRRGDRRRLHVEQAQHPGRVEAETVIAVQHTAERVGREHVGQRGGRGDKGSEPFPARPGGDYPVQGRAIVLRSKQSTTDFGTGLQRVPTGSLFVGDPGFAKAFGGPLETAYDAKIGRAAGRERWCQSVLI